MVKMQLSLQILQAYYVKLLAKIARLNPFYEY